VTTFGLSGIKLIMMALSRMLLSYLLQLTRPLDLEHYSAWQTKYDKTSEVWKSPSPPNFKINYDTAIRATFSAKAAVCRDSTGSIIKCTSIISSHYSALYGEATATLLAACLAASLGLSSFILEGDSLNITMALQQPAITTDWRIASIISIFTLPSHKQLAGKLVM